MKTNNIIIDLSVKYDHVIKHYYFDSYVELVKFLCASGIGEVLDFIQDFQAQHDDD